MGGLLSRELMEQIKEVGRIKRDADIMKYINKELHKLNALLDNESIPKDPAYVYGMVRAYLSVGEYIGDK